MKKYRIKRLLIVIGVIILTLVMPARSVMAEPDTETLRPNAAGDETTNKYYDGSLHDPDSNENYKQVDEVTPDEDSTYVTIPAYGSWFRDLYNLPASSGSGTINFIKVYVRGKHTGDPNQAWIKVSIKSGATQQDGDQETLTTDYVNYSHEWALNPDDGEAWEWADIDDLQIGLIQKGTFSGYSHPNCTQVYVEVDYTSLTTPTVTTQDPTNTDNESATGNGNITSIGGENCDYRGFVWDTSSHGDPGDVAPPATYSDNITASGNFTAGAFIGSITGLVQGATYYYRAFAHNSEGWSYGDERTFVTDDVPTITTDDATDVAYTTARLHSSLTDDGGEACDVRFQYNTTDNWSAFCDNTTWVGGYTTGQQPYADIMGLSQNTLYYFRVQAKNTYGTANATSLSFTTASSLAAPTNFKAFPEAEQVVLSWTRGTGTTTTLIRYKEGAYPTTVADGVQVYNGVLGTTAHTGLTSGHSYYYSAWGVSGANSTATYATVMATTLPLPAAGDVLPAPDMPSTWFGTPDYTKFSELPFYPFINLCADATGMPRNSFWLWGTLYSCMFSGIIVFAISRDGKPTMITIAVTMAVASVIELLPMFMMGLAVLVFLGSLQLKRGAR